MYVPVWLGFRYSGLLWEVEVQLQPNLGQRCNRVPSYVNEVKGHIPRSRVIWGQVTWKMLLFVIWVSFEKLKSDWDRRRKMTSDLDHKLVGVTWLQLILKYANESHLTFSDYLLTWPQMTFDLDVTFDLKNIWSLVPDFNFQMRPISHFQPILQLDLRWPLTLVTFDLINKWRFPCCIYDLNLL